MSDVMMFPKTVDEFMEQYKVVDTEHIYSNGVEFVPMFRMKQWFEHISSTVDAVEVVRCKECKHYGTSLKGVPTQGYCKLTEWQTRHDNDYCSMGERKDGR